MGDTSIEWTRGDDGTPGKSWNPVAGCSVVSPGCHHCYARAMAARFSGPGKPYHGLAVMTEHGPQWTGDVRLLHKHLTDPLKWRRHRRVFVNSMSDLFHEGLSDGDIDRVFAVMAICATHDTRPAHTFQILTKRAARMRKYISAPIGDLRNRLGTIAGQMMDDGDGWHDSVGCHMPWPLPNVWLGVSAEDQPRADERIPELLDTPAAVRFVSYEPALGPVSLWAYLKGEIRDRPLTELGSSPMPGLNWVICGAESGPGARAFNPDWARAVLDECERAGVAFFYKQDARNGHKLSTPELDGKRWVQFPDSARPA
jgi:protein gp37